MLLIRGAFVVAALAVGISLDPWDLVEDVLLALLTVVPAVIGSAAVTKPPRQAAEVLGSVTMGWRALPACDNRRGRRNGALRPRGGTTGHLCAAVILVISGPQEVLRERASLVVCLTPATPGEAT